MRTWWHHADASSIDSIVVVLVIGLGLRVIVMEVGLDHLTTIDIMGSLICDVAVSLVGVAATVLAARSWFGPPPESQVKYQLRRDRPGVWWLWGATWTAISVATSAWICAELLSVGAQYLEGSDQTVRGQVVSFRPTSTPRTVCKQRLTVRDEGDGSLLHICLRTSGRGSLADTPPKLGESVAVDLKNTVLGRVVLSVRFAHHG